MSRSFVEADKYATKFVFLFSSLQKFEYRGEFFKLERNDSGMKRSREKTLF